MRINFKSALVPTRAAKRLKAALSIKESLAKEWTAQVYGYRNWHELLQMLGTTSPSPLDEHCTPDEVRARREYQASRLQACLDEQPPATALVKAETLIETWQPSAGHPKAGDVLLSMLENPWKTAANVVLGYDKPVLLKKLGPELLAQLPAHGKEWLDKEACGVARRLLRNGSREEAPFARKILEELHARGVSAGTLHLALSLRQGSGGPRDVARAEVLFQSLRANPDTPDNIRVVALDGLASIAGEDGMADMSKAVATWEARALEGDPLYAYRTALACDPLKPATQFVRSDVAKAVKFYLMAALQDHVPSASNLGLLLSGHPELCEYPGQAQLWLGFAAGGGDKLALEVAGLGYNAAAQIAALPRAAAVAQITDILRRYIPTSERGEDEVVPGGSQPTGR